MRYPLFYCARSNKNLANRLVDRSRSRPGPSIFAADRSAQQTQRAMQWNVVFSLFRAEQLNSNNVVRLAGRSEKGKISRSLQVRDE